MARDTDGEARYLYCIIKCKEEGSFDGLQGIAGGPVYTVGFGDLACVVSGSPDVKYDSTRANMMVHETVIEQVMLGAGFTILPVRFGTVTRKGSTSPEEDIRHKLLKSRFKEFQDLRNQMEGKVELGLKALWRDEKAIFDEIVVENKEIRRARNSLMGSMNRTPEATHWDRTRLGERVKAAMDAKRDRETRNLLSCLRPMADQVRENKIIMDRMVLNAAFLVDRRREGAFDELVKKLDVELGGRMVLKYTGPNPPYNFCEIVVTWEED